MNRQPCCCRWCGAPLPPQTGLIAYGFCSDEHRQLNNRAALAGLTPTQAQAPKEAAA